MDFLSLVPVGNSTEKKNAKIRAKTSSSYFDIERFPCRFVDEYQRLSIDVCMIGNSDTNLAYLPISVQLWGGKLLKTCQNFFKAPCKGRKKFDEWTSCLPAYLCMGRYLCLEPLFQVALRTRFHVPRSAVTSPHCMPVRRVQLRLSADSGVSQRTLSHLPITSPMIDSHIPPPHSARNSSFALRPANSALLPVNDIPPKHSPRASLSYIGSRIRAWESHWIICQGHRSASWRSGNPSYRRSQLPARPVAQAGTAVSTTTPGRAFSCRPLDPDRSIRLQTRTWSGSNGRRN